MSLSLLFVDELKGFYRSKVMLFLWVGLPALTVILRLLDPATEGMPFTVVSALLVSSIGGTLAAVMLAVSIINEKEKDVYDLFLIRPIKRRDLIISKFGSVYLCIGIASALALLTGVIIDFIEIGGFPEAIIEDSARYLVTSLSMMAISSSAGVLIGVLAPSVLVGVVLVIYGANQISIIPSLPALANTSNQMLFSLGLGGSLAVVLLGLSIFFMNRKQF